MASASIALVRPGEAYIPLNRLGVPDDVAAAIFFLCGSEAAYITGTEIFVTGGQHVY